MTDSAPFLVAACQTVSGTHVEANLAAAGRLVAEAAAQGAKLVALPEYFCLMGASDDDKVRVREPFDAAAPAGPIQRFLSETAAKHGIWLVGGTVPLAADDPAKVLNTTLVYGPDGAVAARYDKIHLFGFRKGEESYDESRTIVAGEPQPAVFDAPFGRVGLSICYDLRFPELFRAMGDVGLIVLPAAFTHTTGSAHWEVLLRARAVENQCYVLASAQGGKHENGRRTWGHSMLIDPWGNIVSVKPEGEGIAIGAIDLKLIEATRGNLPALRHRRM
ncbi:carbon-nitrogen hydrolase family protein [Derxia gummosa]|uniref:Carbon-nitrogen hydrolase family protein n=1 Tax=Derxia gummosa DSM 723 TaxID=1121388 RepID=A0A8B6X7C6_9BURK|nr:carbon-nitrogen hydrolase family protein [Derxia gummosa]